MEKSSVGSPFDQTPSNSGGKTITKLHWLPRASKAGLNILKSTNVLLFNARSLLNKLSALFFLLSVNQFDLIFVTETWLKPCYTNSFITNSSGYDLIRFDRLVERGGGVAVFYKREISSKIHQIDINIRDSDKFEILSFDIYYQKQSDRYVCIYLSPTNAKDPEVVVKLLGILKKLYTPNNFHILGDLNFSFIN